ncbi:MAG: HD domain-containing protein, partial [Planctomycetes bacterium]|nr:HD domain-containing protein [Planctomycetota bacterium]
RHVTAAFREDPLRVLRAARFAARLDFAIAPETLELMRAITASGELATLAAERVWGELRRALMAPYPARFIGVLRECGALAALLPEVDRLFGVPQPARYHPEIDTGEHVLLALTQAERRDAPETVRFAVLVHDLGKGTTPPAMLPSHRGHEERGVALIEALATRLRVPREHRELACLVAALHTRVHRAEEMKPATVVGLLEQADAWRRAARFEQFLEACLIDATGRAGWADRDYPQAAWLRRAAAITATVDARALAASGLKGEALRAAIHQARVEALTRSGN